MLQAQKYIEIARSRGERKLPLNRVYRMIRHRDLFLAAYGKLYANKGATTAGVDPDDTVDGMSLKRIDKIIAQLESGTYRWKPVKRVHIDKKKGGTRPLGLPSWNDKLLQEVIRSILEAYYEPQFANSSHGFRPHRSCYTALENIRHCWTGTKWFIEGDIKGCFDNGPDSEYGGDCATLKPKISQVFNKKALQSYFCKYLTELACPLSCNLSEN